MISATVMGTHFKLHTLIFSNGQNAVSSDAIQNSISNGGSNEDIVDDKHEVHRTPILQCAGEIHHRSKSIDHNLPFGLQEQA